MTETITMGKPIEGIPNKCEGPDKAPQETIAGPGPEGQGGVPAEKWGSSR